MLLQLFTLPGAVEQEDTAGLNVLNHVISADVSRVTAGNKVSVANVVSGSDFIIAKTQMANRQAAGFFRVILEVGLNLLVGMVTDDLDGVLAGTDQTVCTQTPELAGNSALLAGNAEGLGDKREVGDIVIDADSEATLGLIKKEVIVDCQNIVGSGVFGAKTVATADNLDAGTIANSDGACNIQVQRLTGSTGLLGAVENSNALYALGQLCEEVLCGEGAVKADGENTNLVADGVEVINGLFCGAADRTHSNDDILCIGCTVVIKRLVVGAALGIDLIHSLFNNIYHALIVEVACFSVLEEDFGRFGRTAAERVSRIVCVCAEALNSVPIHHFLQIIVIPGFNFLDFVAGAETVKEVHDRQAALNSGKVGNCGQVHNFLRSAGSQHGKACGAAGHNVRVITKDGQSVRCQRTGCNMNNTGQHLACNLVQVGNHQQKTLRSGKGSGQSTGGQRAVECTGGAAFRLHFNDVYRLTKDILLFCSSPNIGMLSHSGRRSDGVNGGNFGEGIGYVCSCFIAVHSLEFTHHFLLLS